MARICDCVGVWRGRAGHKEMVYFSIIRRSVPIFFISYLTKKIFDSEDFKYDLFLSCMWV